MWCPWKLSKFQDPSPVHLHLKIFRPLDLGCPISNDPPPPLNDNQLIKRKHDRRMTIICYQQINYRIIHHLQWLLLTLSRMGYWPGYLWWLWLASHCLPYFLHTSYPQFPHWEWVERQESVDLVASALSHIRFHAYDICSRHKSNLL